ncbi:MAG: anti-sigma factor domain-containing protein [Labedaea sp.]
MSPDVHALTGAYVLDAVPELERAAFERHLAECDACAQEVRELRETATRLGQTATAEPPPGLRSAVLARISEVRQLPPEQPPGGQRSPGRARLTLWLTSSAAAVLLVVATVLGVLLVRERGALDDARQSATSLSSILDAGDVKASAAKVDSGGSALVVTSRAQNRGLILASGLAEPPSGHVYQAWLRDSTGDMHPAGLLPGAGTARLDLNDVNTANGVGLTVEPAGGSPAPTTGPVMLVDLPV